MPIKDRDRVSRSTFPAFQVGQRDGHVKLRRQGSEVRDERAILAHRLCSPYFDLVGSCGIREGVSDTPHLREQREVRAHLLGASAEGLPFGKIGFPVVPIGSHLQQRNRERVHWTCLSPGRRSGGTRPFDYVSTVSGREGHGGSRRSTLVPSCAPPPLADWITAGAYLAPLRFSAVSPDSPGIGRGGRVQSPAACAPTRRPGQAVDGPSTTCHPVQRRLSRGGRGEAQRRERLFSAVLDVRRTSRPPHATAFQSVRPKPYADRSAVTTSRGNSLPARSPPDRELT